MGNYCITNCVDSQTEFNNNPPQTDIQKNR